MGAIRALIGQAGERGTNSNMKVKWNACYGIGNAMKNATLFELSGSELDWKVSCYNSFSLGALFVSKILSFVESLELDNCHSYVLMTFRLISIPETGI